MKPAANPAELLHKAGLIFHINRTVLHPLGLALYCVQNEDGTFEPGIGILETEDHEPIEYAPDPERDRDREAWLAAFTDRILAARGTKP